MRILLTNDDGIYAPGLRALRPELRKLGAEGAQARGVDAVVVGQQDPQAKLL